MKCLTFSHFHSHHGKIWVNFNDTTLGHHLSSLLCNIVTNLVINLSDIDTNSNFIRVRQHGHYCLISSPNHNEIPTKALADAVNFLGQNYRKLQKFLLIIGKSIVKCLVLFFYESIVCEFSSSQINYLIILFEELLNEN